MKELKPRQSLVLDHWFLDACGSRTKAMLKAGYTEQTSMKKQTEYFDRPEMVAEIERRRAALTQKYELKLEWVVERLMAIADSGATLAKFIKVTDDGYLDWDFTNATPEELSLINGVLAETTETRGGTVKKFKISTAASDRKGALDSLARILGAFNDNLTLKGELSMVERLHAGRARVKRENKKEYLH